LPLFDAKFIGFAARGCFGEWRVLQRLFGGFGASYTEVPCIQYWFTLTAERGLEAGFLQQIAELSRPLSRPLFYVGGRKIGLGDEGFDSDVDSCTEEPAVTMSLSAITGGFSWIDDKNAKSQS
jgi:hypothetical protein